MLIAIALAALQADNLNADRAARWARKARPVATCSTPADCAAKWAKGRAWIERNSEYRIWVDTPQLLATTDAAYPRLSLAYVMVLNVDPKGGYTISARAWCGNVLRCSPSTKAGVGYLAAAINSAA